MCGKRWSCSLWEFSPFVTILSNVVCCRGIRKRLTVGGLKYYIRWCMCPCKHLDIWKSPKGCYKLFITQQYWPGHELCVMWYKCDKHVHVFLIKFVFCFMTYILWVFVKIHVQCFVHVCYKLLYLTSLLNKIRNS